MLNSEKLKADRKGLEALDAKSHYLFGLASPWERRFQKQQKTLSRASLKTFAPAFTILFSVLNIFLFALNVNGHSTPILELTLPLNVVLIFLAIYLFSRTSAKSYYPAISFLSAAALGILAINVMTSASGQKHALYSMIPYIVVLIILGSRLPFMLSMLGGLSAGIAALLFAQGNLIHIDWGYFHQNYTAAYIVTCLMVAYIENNERAAFLQQQFAVLEKNTLKLQSQSYEAENTISQQVTDLQEGIRSNGDPEDLGLRIFSALAKHIPLHAGVMYLPRKQKQTLHAVATYACKKPKKDFHWSESLPGQVYLSKEPQHLDMLPEQYLQVESSLGSSDQVELYIWPVMFENEVIAIIEIASMNQITDAHMKLLSRSQRSIAMATMAAITRKSASESHKPASLVT